MLEEQEAQPSHAPIEADVMERMMFVTPSSRGSNLETVQSFYLALLHEMEHGGYTDAERTLLADERLYYGRYLNPRLRSYFEQTVIPQVAHGVSFLMSDTRTPRILDLGCGLGMQSIILASMGAEVVGLDVRKEAVELCMKRKAYHEQMLGMKLNIEFVQRDFLKTHPDDFHSRFDSVFSMAAFASIRPLEHTAKLISAVLKDDARILIYEKNSDHPLHQLRKSPEPGPTTVSQAFAREGFECTFLEGGCALPGAFWKFPRLNDSVVAPTNNLLRKTLRLSFNYVQGFKRRGRAVVDSQAHRIGVLVLCVCELLPDWVSDLMPELPNLPV
jgi:SAM-dependent methyltransferase